MVIFSRFFKDFFYIEALVKIFKKREDVTFESRVCFFEVDSMIPDQF